MAVKLFCPFCGYSTNDEYALTLHVEDLHTEDSPFTTRTAAGPSDSISLSSTDWIQCTRPDCGDLVLLFDLDEHLAIHEATEVSENDRRPRKQLADTQRANTPTNTHEDAAQARRLDSNSRKSPRQHKRAPARIGPLDRYFGGTSALRSRPPPLPPRPQPAVEQGRLGRRDLGPYAFEKRMPEKVRDQLIRDARPQTVNRMGRDGRLFTETFVENETSGLIAVLADLSALDRDVKATYLCRPNVKHVRKIRCEGNFCGYWSLQTLLSSYDDRPDRLLPNVIQIQNTIEEAWDVGLCSYSRTETGGIRGSRKWIGSMEASAYLMHTGITVDAITFKDEETGKAYEKLLDHVEAYFMSASESADVRGTSLITRLTPVYLQRRGHSLTIVGLQRWGDGSRDLLVFDSTYATPRAMWPLLRGQNVRIDPKTLVNAYRRDERHLRAWDEFEIVVPGAPIT